MERLPPLSYDDMSDRQKQVYREIAAGPRGEVRGPLAVWLNRPELADGAQALGRYCRYDSLLPPRLSELAILTTARVWGSEYEWAVHKPIALDAGISPDTVEAIRSNREPAFSHPDEAVVFRFARTLHTKRRIDDDLFDQTVAVLGADATVDLVGLLGYYTLISMTINVFGAALPDGREPELGSEPTPP